MKKIKYIILMAFLAYLTIGASCEDHLVQLPVVGYVEHTLTVNSGDFSYSQSENIDFTNEINQIKNENTFENIVSITLESVSYTILNNNSGQNATITGLAKVSSPIGAPLVDLANMSNIVLENIENEEQYMTLLDAGVDEINEAIDVETGNGQLSISINGDVTPSVNLDFDIKVKITFTLIGEVKTEVPVI